MNKKNVRLPFTDVEIEQLTAGHPITDAADFLQSTIVQNHNARHLKGLELGSGNGIITFMLALQKPDWQLTGIELQPELYELSIRNNKRVGLSCSFVQGDLREFRAQLGYMTFDLIYSNPPWVRAGAGKVSPDEGRAQSRQEITCTMKDVLTCIDWCLTVDGSAWIVYPLDRKTELAKEMMRINLEAVNLYHSEQRPHSFVACLRHKPAGQRW
ncbi:MAG: methyltransferase domain-containing protein [Candidatus Cloacimonadaceae bacterium]